MQVGQVPQLVTCICHVIGLPHNIIKGRDISITPLVKSLKTEQTGRGSAVGCHPLALPPYHHHVVRLIVYHHFLDVEYLGQHIMLSQTGRQLQVAVRDHPCRIGINHQPPMDALVK
jgi:hypothetical protein